MEKQQTIIFLARHGETDFAYVSDPEIDAARVLTKRGIEQSQENGRYLRDFAPVAIYSSPLKRTLQTAHEIVRAAEMTTDVKAERDLLEIYDNDSWLSIKTRLPKLFEKIVSEHSGHQVVCVTHLDVIQGVLKALGATPSEAGSLCQMGEMYRLVFAGKVFVQATKLCLK
jgi:broad specificity phosphatase PhoE